SSPTHVILAIHIPPMKNRKARINPPSLFVQETGRYSTTTTPAPVVACVPVHSEVAMTLVSAVGSTAAEAVGTPAVTPSEATESVAPEKAVSAATVPTFIRLFVPQLNTTEFTT